MRIALILLLLATPAFAQAPPHSGQVVQNGFLLSDVALFAFAAVGVWLAQRSMRKRARRRAAPPPSAVSADSVSPETKPH
jgi:hypothetical protein